MSILPAPHDDLDRLLREEKQRVALEFFEDAWQAALDEGIEPAILAETAVEAALTGLDREEGQSSVARLVAALGERCENGAFIADRVLQ